MTTQSARARRSRTTTRTRMQRQRSSPRWLGHSKERTCQILGSHRARLVAWPVQNLLCEQLYLLLCLHAASSCLQVGGVWERCLMSLSVSVPLRVLWPRRPRQRCVIWCSGLSCFGLEPVAAAGPHNTLATAGSADSHCPACMGRTAVLPPRQSHSCKHIDMPVMLYLAHHCMRTAR